MAGDCFQIVDVSRARRVLAGLHERVAMAKGRIEIKRRGCDEACVMISKAELDALERALEILCESAEYKQMCEVLTRLAADTSGVPDGHVSA